MKLHIAAIAALLLVSNQQDSAAVNLLRNGDFEIIATNDNGPVLDAYGNEQPINWFRSIHTPDEEPIPLTELISPANMNNAAGNNQGDDSDGSGTNSAALNYVADPFIPPYGVPADWRSWTFDTVPGETLIFSMDFKFIGVSPDEQFDGFNGLFAQIRSFEDETPGHSNAGAFVGERNVPTRFRQHFAPDVWHNVTDRVEVPAGGEFTDVRVSVNTFGAGRIFQGQVLIDDIQVTRLTADFDDDLDVDGADLALWQSGFGPNAGGDVDADGDSDGADFLVWQQENGLVVPEFLPPPDPPMATAAVGAVPEPAGAALVFSGVIASLLAFRRR